MSAAVSSQRFMSVDVHASNHAAIARPPCSPITNEPPRSKGSFSFANLMPKRSATPSQDSKPKKPKKEGIDLAAMYGTEFARAVAADQFLNGGRLEDSIARVQRNMDKFARRRAEKLGVPYVPDAAAPVHGPNGELFRDAQDESERRGLVRNAYKGMPEPTAHKSSSRGMRSDEELPSSDSEDNDAPWSQFRAQPVRRDNARDAFFANSFAPQPVRRA